MYVHVKACHGILDWMNMDWMKKGSLVPPAQVFVAMQVSGEAGPALEFFMSSKLLGWFFFSQMLWSFLCRTLSHTALMLRLLLLIIVVDVDVGRASGVHILKLRLALSLLLLRSATFFIGCLTCKPQPFPTSSVSHVQHHSTIDSLTWQHCTDSTISLN